MILLDQPYVSEFLQHSLTKNNIPVIDTEAAQALKLDPRVPRISEQQAIAQLMTQQDARLYSNSENSIGWISQHLAMTKRPQQINSFKNKVEFRQLLQPLYPEFFFCEVPFAELASTDTANWPWPVIVKPAVGFFSMGVHKVTSAHHWQQIVTTIHGEIEQAQGLYPQQVLDTATFIVEGCLAGEEYAIDAYFDDEGQPVILNILHHLFSSGDDVSDRIYLTSAGVILKYQQPLLNLLKNIGQLRGLKNFPVHLEVRIDDTGKITPIELNPLRFAGWCTTDIAHHAYDINPYHCFFNNIKPDWQQLAQKFGERITSFIILDRPTTIPLGQIDSFDYERLLDQLSQPVELRKVDYHHYPVFGIVFAHTQPETFGELTQLLQADMTDFINLKKS